MNKSPGGKPAFPQAGNPDCTGVTIRDYFAAQVLAGAMHEDYSPGEFAPLAYQYADAMLAEREKVKA